MCARTVLPATKDDAGIATRHPQFASLVSARRCQRVNPSRTDFRTSRIRHFLQRSLKRRDSSERAEMFSTRPPADFRIQRMRAADEKSNQMQAYVKVHAALQLSFPVVDTRPRYRAQSFPSICPRTDHRPRSRSRLSPGRRRSSAPSGSTTATT